MFPISHAVPERCARPLSHHRSRRAHFLRNAYRQIFPMHTDPMEQSMEMVPVLQMGRIDIPAAVEENTGARC